MTKNSEQLKKKIELEADLQDSYNSFAEFELQIADLSEKLNPKTPGAGIASLPTRRNAYNSTIQWTQEQLLLKALEIKGTQDEIKKIDKDLSKTQLNVPTDAQEATNTSITSSPDQQEKALLDKMVDLEINVERGKRGLDKKGTKTPSNAVDELDTARTAFLKLRTPSGPQLKT